MIETGSRVWHISTGKMFQGTVVGGYIAEYDAPIRSIDAGEYVVSVDWDDSDLDRHAEKFLRRVRPTFSEYVEDLEKDPEEKAALDEARKQYNN